MDNLEKIMGFKHILIKEKNQNVPLYYCHSTKFKTFYTYCVFFKEYEKISSLHFEILGKLLNRTTLNHPTEQQLSVYCANLYDMYHYVSTKQFPHYDEMLFRTGTVNTKYIHENINLLEESTSLLKETIFEPNFSLEILEDIKLSIINKINNAKNNNLYNVTKKFNLERFSGELIEEQMYINPEDVKAVTMDDIKIAYNNLLKCPHIYVYIGEDKLDDVVNSLSGLDFPISNKVELKNECRHNKVIEKVKEVYLDEDLNQSQLLIGLRTNIYSKDEDFYPMLFCELLLGGDSNSELFRVVRKNNNLAYDISFRYNSLYGFITIKAGVDKNNLEKTYELVKEVINNFKNGNISKEHLETEKKYLISNLKTEFDDFTSHYNLALSHYRGDKIKTVEEKITLINSITVEDIKRAANSMEYELVYFVRGTKDESN